IGCLVIQGNAWSECKFLVTVAHLADDIVPAVIPAYADFFANHRPSTMARAERPGRLTIRFEFDKKGSAVAVAYLPYSQKVVRPDRRLGQILVFNSGDLGHRICLLMAILERNHDRDGVL